MKLNTKKIIFSVVALAICIHYVSAAPLQINVTGNVTASPCSVDIANSTLNIDLGDTPATDLATAGAFGQDKQFTLALKDCPASTTKATATFSGTATAGDANGFANTGTAVNVAIKIKPAAAAWSDNSVNPNQSSWQQNVNATSHTVKYDFAVRPYTVSGNVSPGTIASTMQVAFTYQ
ncbi:MAG: fimbrial protein [Silvania sp.]